MPLLKTHMSSYWHAEPQALTVKTTVPISCMPPFPKISRRSAPLRERGSAAASPAKHRSRCDPKRHYRDVTHEAR